MDGVSKVFEMQQRIASKLRAVGANSNDKAVTAQEAVFDVSEQNWLGYIAGGLFALVKKPRQTLLCCNSLLELVHAVQIA